MSPIIEQIEIATKSPQDSTAGRNRLIPTATSRSRAGKQKLKKRGTNSGFTSETVTTITTGATSQEKSNVYPQASLVCSPPRRIRAAQVRRCPSPKHGVRGADVHQRQRSQCQEVEG